MRLEKDAGRDEHRSRGPSAEPAEAEGRRRPPSARRIRRQRYRGLGFALAGSSKVPSCRRSAAFRATPPSSLPRTRYGTSFGLSAFAKPSTCRAMLRAEIVTGIVSTASP